MDVVFCTDWWLDLDDKLYIGDIQAPGSHISRNKNLHLSFLEFIQPKLPQLLIKITVQYNRPNLEILSQIVGISFGVGKDKHPTITGVFLNQMHDSLSTVEGVYFGSHMFDGCGCPFVVDVEHFYLFFSVAHVAFADAFYPVWHCGREEQHLGFRGCCAEDLV